PQINLTLFTMSVVVRYGGRFPRAHRKPQPSLSRGLLRLTCCAFPQESPAFATNNYKVPFILNSGDLRIPFSLFLKLILVS
ncbi:hypothetical protein, partial [Lysinibacillus sphaericus]|uniref:hypothetical protein n=1 Tax=Lysinibacillus sphaericus TaxID=1421 RepID=UPI001C3FE015